MKKAAFTAVAALLLLAVVEALSLGACFLVAGGPGAIAGKRGALASMGGGADRIVSAARIGAMEVMVHPYAGSVSVPDGKGHVNRLGFLGAEMPLAGSESVANVVVFGGSVAANFFLYQHAGLAAQLDEAGVFPGRKAVVYCAAQAGYKQPQQLMILNYLLSLGVRIDAVITIDGFNEAVMSVTSNLKYGVWPVYPLLWRDITVALDDKFTRDSVGAISLYTDISRQLAVLFDQPLIRHSPLANLTWLLLDRILSGRANSLSHALQEHKRELKPYQSGPTGDLSPEEALELSADVWSRSSRLMWALASARGVKYLHVLQPNQYVPGSKPLSPGELKAAISPDKSMAVAAEAGYRALRQRIPSIRQDGAPVLDATMLFENVREDLYFDTCCHFNQAGNVLLARAIAQAASQAWK